jgi:uncharacterized protein YgbK (DUF1537 family)
MTRLGTAFTIAVPALPVNGRTQFQGHLFVLGQLLSDSPMRNHPLNPMTDSNLVRWLQQQTVRRIGLVPFDRVREGCASIQREYARLQQEGVEIALVDVASEQDLAAIAAASADLRLITGGSGLAMRLPQVWRERGRMAAREPKSRTDATRGGTLILAGSCSSATLKQLEQLEASGCAVERMDPIALLKDPAAEIDRLADLSARRIRQGGLAAIRSSAPAGQRQDDAAAAIEQAFGEIARRVTATGLAGRLIVAGGETSGAVVNALGIHAVEITGIIDPGVPGLVSCGEPQVLLALKSGNFGAVDFFEKTIRMWEQQDRA